MRETPRRRWALIIPLAVSGVLGIALGGVALGTDLTRRPTANEIEAAGHQEIAARWRSLTAGEIFPARTGTSAYHPVHRSAAESGTPGRSALRVGIAPRASCRAGFDRAFADVLVAHGCRTVLRATYVDGSGTLVTTIGVAVMPDAQRAVDTDTAFGTGVRVGVRAVPFPGTVAEGFGDSLRHDFWHETNGTPYVFFSASGWITDRADPVTMVAANTFAFARTALDQVVLRFADTTEPCQRRAVRC